MRTQASCGSLVTVTDFGCFDVKQSRGSAPVALWGWELPFLVIVVEMKAGGDSVVQVLKCYISESRVHIQVPPNHGSGHVHNSATTNV